MEPWHPYHAGTEQRLVFTDQRHTDIAKVWSGVYTCCASGRSRMANRIFAPLECRGGAEWGFQQPKADTARGEGACIRWERRTPSHAWP